MYAIADIQGFQFKLEKDKWLLVPKLNAQVGDKVKIDEILAYRDANKMLFGKPYLKNVSIEAKVIEPLIKAKKIIIFKFKKRKRYRRKMGYRSQYTKLMIEDISLS